MKSSIKRVIVFLSSLVVSAFAILVFGFSVNAAPSNMEFADASNANTASQCIQVFPTNIYLGYSLDGVNYFPINSAMSATVIFGPISNNLATELSQFNVPTINSNQHFFYLDARTNFTSPQIANNTSVQCSLKLSFDINGVHYEDVKQNVTITTGTNKDFGGEWVFSGGLNSSSSSNTSSGSGENPFASQFYQHINDTANEIGLAAQGLNADGSVNETKTVFYSAPSVYSSIIKAVMNAEGVTFFVTYEFDGYVFCSAITPEYAAEMYREDITWYGPAYIANHCPTVMIGQAV